MPRAPGAPSGTSAAGAPAAGGSAVASPRLSFRRLTAADQRVLITGIAIVVTLELALVWLPALASVALSFTKWDGIGAIEPGDVVGLRNYEQLVTSYPRFWSAVVNNGLWLAALLCIAVPAGLALAVILDRGVRGGRFYQGALYLPVLLSLALIGFIWELQLSPGNGLLNGLLGRTAAGDQIDWLGDRSINRFVVLVPAIWRHVGYVMVLYLAGLKATDPQLREAAMIDGAGERQAFMSVVLPALQPVTVVVLIVTAIQALRAFDIVYVLNGGLNGLEVLSVLITANVLGEASRLGFGSAIATVLLVAALIPISAFLRRVEKDAAA